MSKEFIVLDIETTGLDTVKDKIVLIGIFFTESNEYTILRHNDENKQKIQSIIDNHINILTFNGDEFDIPFMMNNGYEFEKKRLIDVFKIFKYKRTSMIKFEGFKSYSLRNLAEELGLSILKGDIDYKIFQRTNWTNEEKELIIKYLKADLQVTYLLWQHLEKVFDSFKELLPIESVNKYHHITTSAGSYAYAALCYATGLEVKYNDVDEENEPYQGGYVSKPVEDSYKGNIYCLDFNSAYPHAYMQMNLFTNKNSALACTCCKDEELWHGNDLFPVEGYYCSKNFGKIEQTIQKIYKKRKELGKNHPLNIPLKILLNTLYGITAKPNFHWIYSKTTSSDCTLFARESLKYARKTFAEHGYTVIYSDTDSVYLVDDYYNIDKLNNVKNNIIKHIKSNVPFPQDTFDMGFDAEIKYIQFFKDKKNQFKMKNYLYVTNDNKLKIKGLAIIKKDCSKISQIIFEKLKPQIISNLNCKFNDSDIYNLVMNELRRDISLIGKRFNVKDKKSYKSNTCVQYMISEGAGEGEHVLFKNKDVGYGKKVKYCTLEELKKLDITQLDLKSIFEELSPFALNGLVKYK